MNIPPKDKQKVITDPAVTAETDDLSTDEAVAAGDTQIKSANEDKTDDDEHRKNEAADDLNVDNSQVGLNKEEDNNEFL
ncbi:MAG: hypothetical protein EOO92_05685 [Pedobacter sp.]|nr:MAG: hypothetical protein EOO92_05685 [Pedobacter sp.]